MDDQARMANAVDMLARLLAGYGGTIVDAATTNHAKGIELAFPDVGGRGRLRL